MSKQIKQQFFFRRSQIDFKLNRSLQKTSQIIKSSKEILYKQDSPKTITFNSIFYVTSSPAKYNLQINLNLIPKKQEDLNISNYRNQQSTYLKTKNNKKLFDQQKKFAKVQTKNPEIYSKHQQFYEKYGTPKKMQNRSYFNEFLKTKRKELFIDDIKNINQQSTQKKQHKITYFPKNKQYRLHDSLQRSSKSKSKSRSTSPTLQTPKQSSPKVVCQKFFKQLIKQNEVKLRKFAIKENVQIDDSKLQKLAKSVQFNLTPEYQLKKILKKKRQI